MHRCWFTEYCCKDTVVGMLVQGAGAGGTVAGGIVAGPGSNVPGSVGAMSASLSASAVTPHAWPSAAAVRLHVLPCSGPVSCRSSHEGFCVAEPNAGRWLLPFLAAVYILSTASAYLVCMALLRLSMSWALEKDYPRLQCKLHAWGS